VGGINASVNLLENFIDVRAVGYSNVASVERQRTVYSFVLIKISLRYNDISEPRTRTRWAANARRWRAW
jgi:hypothetical protein